MWYITFGDQTGNIAPKDTKPVGHSFIVVTVRFGTKSRILIQLI